MGTEGTVLAVVLLVFSLALHEAAHAWVANACGDPTARHLGRITLNPIPSIDPFMSVALPAMLVLTGSPFLFGGAKPVPVVMGNLRSPMRDMMLVALAGPGTNLLLAAVGAWAWQVATGPGGMPTDNLLLVVLTCTIFFNLLLTVFNLLPVPPLDGSRVLAWLLPQGLRAEFQRLESLGLLLVVLLLFSGFLQPLLGSFLETAASFELFEGPLETLNQQLRYKAGMVMF